VAEKTVKVKQPEKTKQADSAVQSGTPRQPEKAKPLQKAAAKPVDRDREKPRQPNRLARFYRETIGELRKVSWPTMEDTRRLTRIVLIVMFLMSALLGFLDFLFSRAIALLLS
jgi:preprotein translocase subunit SecE